MVVRPIRSIEIFWAPENLLFRSRLQCRLPRWPRSWHFWPFTKVTGLCFFINSLFLHFFISFDRERKKKVRGGEDEPCCIPDSAGPHKILEKTFFFIDLPLTRILPWMKVILQMKRWIGQHISFTLHELCHPCCCCSCCPFLLLGIERLAVESEVTGSNPRVAIDIVLFKNFPFFSFLLV